MISARRWLGWLPWRRANAQSGATDTSTAPSGHAFRLGRQHTTTLPTAGMVDPVLQLAREWLLAQGARLAKPDAEALAGMLPDGTYVRYTCSPLRAHQDPQMMLLAPGTAGREALLGSIERQGTGLTLRAEAPVARPETLARDAFVISPTSDAPIATAGRFVVVGIGRGVRDAVVEHRWAVRTLEYTVRLSVASPFERREELIRLALDAGNHEPRQPLGEAALRQARIVPGEPAASPETDTTSHMLETVERLVEPAARAAARLARAQALPEFHQRQHDIQALYARLLQEAPEQGAALLSARERELRRLADARAIDVQLGVVNVATIVSELARVRVRFGGGGEVVVDVDPCRACVLDSRCPACDNAWQTGARCAEDHITCLDCQQVCGHCGKRRCPLCTSVAYAACPTCGELACDACARAAARGRHRSSGTQGQAARQAPPVARRAADSSPRGEPASMPEDGRASCEDVTVSDLDAMTDATWRACLTWLVESWGYTVERAIDGSARFPELVCRRAAIAPAASEPARFGDVVVVVGYRPDASGEAQPPDVMREMLDLMHRMPGARGLVVTTARGGVLAEYLRSARRDVSSVTDSVAIIDRDALTEKLAEASNAYERERQTAEQQAERRAAVAQTVRDVLLRAAGDAAMAVEQSPLADERAAQRPERGSPDAGEEETRDLEPAAMTVRQALTAMETLVEEWESSFAPVPARDGTLAVVADVATLDGLRERADHLANALADACGALMEAVERPSADVRGWRSAVVEELHLRCLALARRLAAIDPTAWRSFSAAHNAQVAQAAVEVLAASGRAALRAQRLLDEVEARRRNTVRPRAGARTRSRE